jgi:ankyrin repeat protein
MDHSEDQSLPDYMTKRYTALFMDRDFIKAHELVASGHAIDKEPTDEGYTLLHHAVQSGDIESLKFLIQHGCPKAINEFDYISHTPLIWAASEGRLEMARLLIDAGAHVNAHDEERIGDTAIKEAVRVGDFRMCELLLKAGADPAIRGWMQVDAVLQAQLACKADPTSQVRVQILALVSKSN